MFSATGFVSQGTPQPTEPLTIQLAMMQRIWGQPAPWRERGVDPADGHRHSDPVGPYQPLSSSDPLTQCKTPEQEDRRRMSL